ncbi:MAG: DUF445 domain-containing protein [Paraglaciecola sp.]|nr:DUF445 domain-containing protein [Paraglaciecola sp.]
MNKNILTNGLALLMTLIGFGFNNDVIKTMGLFALSGAITNWLAIHMLFEKVPGLYGSGVIPQHFEDFKNGIRNLIMEQFFTAENIQRFMADSGHSANLNFKPILQKVDLAPTFDSLVAVIQASSFGQMLGMFGGVQALEPLKQPFMDKMLHSLQEIADDPAFMALVRDELKQADVQDELQVKISNIVEQRLNELTPQIVKEIVQKMIKQHLGWLVVWGGVFGGLIGLLTVLAPF